MTDHVYAGGKGPRIPETMYRAARLVWLHARSDRWWGTAGGRTWVPGRLAVITSAALARGGRQPMRDGVAGGLDPAAEAQLAVDGGQMAFDRALAQA